MMATATWFIWRQRGKGWLFLLARGAYLTSVIALVLIVVDVLPYWKGSLQLLAWGAATEMLLLTLAVASKVSEYRTRLIKAQEQQLVSARLNEEMARQSAEVLEQRVAQRTQELQASEQRLLAQNEELLQTQEELLAQRDLTEQNQSYLHLVNSRLQANEAILKKAYDKSRASQEKLRAQNEQILAINQKIEQSLQVAQTIQQAILPFPAKKRALLGDYFVFLRPRDVVSGDFFWLNQVDGWTILAVLDCTGHGVPGAFMSLIANTLLDKIVKLEKMVAPQQILTRLNQEIVAMLRQDEGVTQSSMDACICAWRPDGEHFCLEYAGAKRPLYYLPPGEEACLSLLPDRMSIGGAVTKVKTFTGHQLRLPSGSLLYLSTDGFADQNDAQRKRYGSANFVKLLSQISQQPMAAQREALQQALHHYTRHTEQRDDILVIGVHLNQTELPA
jgi:serine phosphatase RsbU (regulator of sigma subunit)